ncbi:hypothetical protein CKM354_000188200 [Cercospora kikuchii]|uniref:Uncharacterized protein n=1 Tax=Cercospora kikuchii TaxID=84275 RepID=A0A9P3CDL7_9PEZI|nr:uncharacterized protein CKM354_000188200 [Cercospora kikuchii]GIZ38465.1 hypothetical protein CKM354_000188200 [Cercospora kikuchii]
MFPNLSAPVHHNVSPRLHQRRRERPFLEVDQTDGGLDLSIHHARGVSRNRFSTLAMPALTATRDREYHVSGHTRRTSNSRGTKEAKKRRDARRNKRKLITQILDEQLSRDIDQALADAKATSHPLPAINATPEPLKPSLTFTWPSWNQVPPTPPQLPVLDFGRLDLRDFPYLTAARPTSSPTRPFSQPRVPEWCPYIPSLMQISGWNGEVPRFTDLSSLPEHDEPLEQDRVQVWRPTPTYQPRKRSRFFPTLTTSISAPVVKLPPTGCKLHKADQELQDPESSAWTAACADRLPCFIGQSNIRDLGDKQTVLSEDMHITDQQRHACEPPEELVALATAANLWRILNEDSTLGDHQLPRNDQETHKHLPSWEYSDDCGGVPIQPIDEERYELPDNEVPYVHLNSLTGHANETGQYPRPINHQSLAQSVLYLADLFATPRSTTPCCELPSYTPSSPGLHILGNGICLPVEPQVNSLRASHHDETAQSTEHYASEQELFQPEQVPLPKSRPQSPCDLERFLSMGHAENCWCRDCAEAPELIEQTEAIEDNDDWLDWSTVEDENDFTMSSPTSGPLTATTTEKPYLKADDHFLGYYDDGLAFSQDDDFYWV